jgi:predicted Fe-Mo cluster-binding NifX family protein
MRLTIPCNSPGGLRSEVSKHFGECDVFTIIEIDPSDTQLISLRVDLLENKDHLNCGSLIFRLKSIGTDAVIVSRISDRPFELLQKENISIYAGEGIVRNVIERFCKNNLFELTQANICPGTQCVH